MAAVNKKDVELELSSSNLAKAKSIYLANGFIVLKNIIPVSFIHAIHQDILAAIRQDKISNRARDVHFLENGEISSAHNLADYVPSYQKLQATESINTFVRYVYGELSPVRLNSSYFAKPKKVGIETKPHQDNAYFCMREADIVTCWLPVTSANKTNGGVYYLPASHKRGNIEHIPEGNLGASMCVDAKVFTKMEAEIPKFYIDLEAGDCVLHNALVVHGSESNTSPYDRNAFNFSIAAAHCVRDEVLFRQYKERLDIFLKNKKPAGDTAAPTL